jgi:hypothetical protein
MITYTYIENVSPKELKKLILENDELKFKHKECSMFFSSEGEHLYAMDVNSPESDPFGDGDFLGAIKRYYNELAIMIELLENLSTVGLELELSDHVNTFNLSLNDLKKFANSLLDSVEIDDLFDCCKNNIEEFGALPVDIEINEQVFLHQDYIKFLNEEQTNELSTLIENHNNQ